MEEDSLRTRRSSGNAVKKVREKPFQRQLTFSSTTIVVFPSTSKHFALAKRISVTPLTSAANVSSIYCELYGLRRPSSSGVESFLQGANMSKNPLKLDIPRDGLSLCLLAKLTVLFDINTKLWMTHPFPMPFFCCWKYLSKCNPLPKILA